MPINRLKKKRKQLQKEQKYVIQKNVWAISSDVGVNQHRKQIIVIKLIGEQFKSRVKIF